MPTEPTASVPTVVAMLLCDQIITEVGTSKKTLVGVFDRCFLPEFPFKLPGFWVYARLTDAEGDYTFKLRFIYLDEEQLLAEITTIKVHAPDRLGFLDLTLPLPPLFPVPKPGRYEFQLYAEEVYIGRTTIQAEERKGA